MFEGIIWVECPYLVKMGCYFVDSGCVLLIGSGNAG